jgi:hypothetical protein
MLADEISDTNTADQYDGNGNNGLYPSTSMQMTRSTLNNDSQQNTSTTAVHVNSQSVDVLLERFTYELYFDSLAIVSTLESLFYLLDLPCRIDGYIDYSLLYNTAHMIWKHQCQHWSHLFDYESFHDRMAIFLCVFHSLMIVYNQQTNVVLSTRIYLDKLIDILQRTIHRVTGDNLRLSCRLQALFMKCYVTLAQINVNSTTSQ